MESINIDDRKILIADLIKFFGTPVSINFKNGERVLVVGQDKVEFREPWKPNFSRDEARKILGLDKKNQYKDNENKIYVKDLKGIVGKIKGDTKIVYLGESGSIIRDDYIPVYTREEAHNILFGSNRQNNTVENSTKSYTREEARRILGLHREENSVDNSTERQF